MYDSIHSGVGYSNLRPQLLRHAYAPLLLRSIAGGGMGVIEMDQKIEAAQRRFPLRKRAIEELAVRDEDFRSLCIDLADAESAALRWENSDAPKRDERRAEYLALVNDLAKEIEAILDTATIIPLPARRPKSQ